MKLALSLISFLAVAVEGSGYSRMVLKYDHGVHLEDVAAAVDVAGVHVERQLACTRGLLISVDEQGLEALQDFGGITVVPEDDSHPVVRRLQGVNTPQGNGECDYAQTCANLRTVAELTVDNVNDIKNEIRSELENGDLSFDGSLGDNAGAVMRLLFHDAASFDKNDAANLSGLNGCVNRGNSGNAGLGNVQAWLVGLQEFLLSDYTINISISDLTVLAAITALEVTIERAKQLAQESGETLEGSLDVEFTYGRPDIVCDCEEDVLPPALTSDGSLYNFEVLDQTMRDTMGFTRKEIVALMGTHTLGAMAFEFSGFSAFLHEERDLDQSAWIGSNDAFDNGWYRFMLRVPWDKKETMVDDVTVIEWLFRDNTFLNSDGALGFEIDFVDDVKGPCNRFGGSNGCNDRSGNPVPGCVVCPPLTNSYGVAVRQYSEDNEKWMKDYSKVFQKMIDDLRPCRQVSLIDPTAA